VDIERKIVLENQLDAIPRLAEAVEAFGNAAALPAKLVFQFTLALDEIVTNVITHGYPDAGQGHIEVTLQRQDGQVRAEVVDDARLFDPLRDAPTPDITAGVAERRIGGLGLHFVKTMMDSVEYHCRDGRNHLKLSKRIDE